MGELLRNRVTRPNVATLAVVLQAEWLPLIQARPIPHGRTVMVGGLRVSTFALGRAERILGW